MYQLPEMVELFGAELDAVTGGQAQGGAVAAGGLVNVALGAANVDVLRAAEHQRRHHRRRYHPERR